MNGQAELGNLSGWSFQKATIVSTVDGKHFKLDTDAYIQQEVPSVLFTKPSGEYLIVLRYKRVTAKDPLNVVTDAFTNVRFRYESGKEDIITVPLSNFQTDWQDTTLQYNLQTEEVLTNIVFGVITKNCIGGMLFDNLQLKPSDNILETGDPTEDNYEKFREMSILYGLEANLPELG
jgi:hypothetical protein